MCRYIAYAMKCLMWKAYKIESSMKKYLVFGLFGALLGLPLLAQPSIVLCDSATEDFLRIDISTLITRNGTDTPASAFEQVEQSDDHGLVFRAHTLTAQALGKCGYSWENGDYMAHSCLDFPFPVIDRTDGDSIILEFDALWDIRKGSGEAGRLVAFLMHEYPAEGPGLDDLLITSGHPFGRPAYNIRILNGSYAGFMGYGGGSDIEGTFEIYQESYWLPGFSARAGGGTYGEGENYPVNSFMEAVEGSPG